MSTAQAGKRDNLIVWMDLEMTGLDPETCHIVEIAMILTDQDLNEVGKPLQIDVWQPEERLATMCPYVRQMHTKTGLLDKIRSSQIDLYAAEKKVMEKVSAHCAYGSARLAGNSIWQDRRFIQRYMTQLDGFLHYRMVDVSAIKELSGWWYGLRYTPERGAGALTGEKHTALYDIKQSIAELKFYRERIFRK